MPDPESKAGRPPRGESRFRRLEYLVVASVVLFVAVVAAVSILSGADQMLDVASHLSARLILAMLALSLVNYLLRAARWQWFAHGLDIHLPPARNALYFIAGFAMTTTPGKAGEALRIWLIERCHGYGYQRVAPMFVGDRLNDMAAILLLCLAGVGAFSGYAELTVGAAVALALLMLPFLRPHVLVAATNGLYALFGRRAPRLFVKIRGALRDTARLFTFRLFGLGLALALVGWCAEIWAFHLLLQALGTAVTFQQAMFVFTFGMIAGTVAMLPGGLGGTEAVMLALLTALGVEFHTAFAATAVIRLTTLWFATALGFLALPVALRLARRARASLPAELA